MPLLTELKIMRMRFYKYVAPTALDTATFRLTFRVNELKINSP
jgi:hypothetical protein